MVFINKVKNFQLKIIVITIKDYKSLIDLNTMFLIVLNSYLIFLQVEQALGFL